MAREILVEPLTADAFRPFGDVIAVGGEPTKWINQGRCARFTDLARLDFGSDGRAGISIFKSELASLPLTLAMMERHPDGSQAFLPMSMDPFLVVVAPDDGGKPGRPRAFLTTAGHGIGLLRGTWHGVLTPLSGPGLFAVVDRIGPGTNLEEHWLAEPWIVLPPS